MRTQGCLVAAMIAALLVAGCGASGVPGTAGLRDSFAEQLAANRSVVNAQRDGDEITFSGPGANGDVAMWRVHIDSAVIEPQDDPALPYKGTVKSSWYSDGQIVQITGQESNLPQELTSNGLAQECWALWDSATARWGWE